MPWVSQRRASVFAGTGARSNSVFSSSMPTLGDGGFATGGPSYQDGPSGTRVGVSDKSLDEFLTGPFIPPPQGAALSGTSVLQRSFPERIGGNLMPQGQREKPLLEHAMWGVGRVAAQPIAAADTILGGALNKGATAIDEGIPVLGDILQFGGEAVHNLFSLPMALMNAQPSAVISEIWNKGDDTVITPELLTKYGFPTNFASQFRKNGAPVLGWLGITGEQMTIGDLKKELEGRGFLNVYEGDTQAQITWEEFAQRTKGDAIGSFKQGHAAVNENEMSSMALMLAGQIAELAPLGVAAGLVRGGIVGSGLVARGLGLGAKAIQHYDRVDAAAAGVGRIASSVGQVAGRVVQPNWAFTMKNAYRSFGKVGDGAINQMAAEGVIDRVALGVGQGAAQLMSGSATGATIRAFGTYGSKVLYPNIPKMGKYGRYLTGQTTVRLASIGAEYGTGALENVIADEDGSNVPMISDVHDFFLSLNNNTLVSDDMVFQTAVSFAYPFRAPLPVLKAVASPVGKYLQRGRENFINRTLAELPKEFGPDMVKQLGGAEEAAMQMDRMVQQIAFDSALRGMPAGIKTAWENLPEATLRMQLIHNTVLARANYMIRKGQIDPHMVVKKFREVHENPNRTFVREDGSMYRGPILNVPTRLSSEAIARRAVAYRKATEHLADPIVGMRTAVLGRAAVMAKEDLEWVIQNIDEAARTTDGMIDAQLVRDLFYETPGLLDDPGVSAATHEFFLDVMLPNKNDPLNAADVLARLKELDPPARSEIWHGLNARDAAAKAADDAARPRDVGMVSNGVARNIHSEDTAKRFVLEADQRVKGLKKTKQDLMATYRSMFSKRGRLKRTASDQNWESAAPAIASEMAVNQVGHFSATTGKSRLYRRGFDVPTDRIGMVPEGDAVGMVEAAHHIRQNYTGADVRFTPSKDTPGMLDVTASYHFTNQDTALAKAAELGVQTIYDASKKLEPRVPPNPVVLVPKPEMDAKIVEITSGMKNLTPDQAVAAGELLRTYAQTYARYNGGSPLDYIDNIEFVSGGRRGAGALRQEAQMLDEWSTILEVAGHGRSSAVKKVMDTSGRQLEVPTGNKPFSLDDAWRVKMQAVNPAKLADDAMIDLYQRTFKAHKGNLADPVDNFRRTAFSMLSPNNNLTSNEIGFAALGIRTFDDIVRIAQMTDDEVVKTIMGVNAGFKSVGAQSRAVRRLAQKMVDDPDLLSIRPGEAPADYLTRISANAGLNMKTANFAAMLSDPVTWPIGTIDVHVTRELISGELSQYLKPEDWPPGLREKYLRTAKTSIVKGKEVVTYNQPGPKGKNTYAGSDYEKFSNLLDIAIHRRYGDLPFEKAGAQWMHWDQVRGSYEPHTAVWPGVENLPRVKAEVYLEAKAQHVNANYLNRNAEILELSPTARFLQRNAEGKTKGSIEWDAQQKTIIRGYESADISTFVHEVGHQIRRDLPDADQLILERHYGVANRQWVRKHEERFARDFERYLHDGRAPTDVLRDTFAKIATWMREIYKTLKGSPIEAKIAPEVREIFDRALGRVDEAAAIDIPGSGSGATYTSGIRTVDEATYNQVSQRGHQIIAKARGGKVRELTHYTANSAKVAQKAHAAVQEQWGGLTYDPRTGKYVAAVKGLEGPYASSAGQTVSLTLKEAKDQARVAAALDEVVRANRELLEREGYYVGVFHDAQAGRIDFDVNLLLKTSDEAIAVQTALGRTGGAYDFATGDGVFGVRAESNILFTKGDFDAKMAEREAMRQSIRDVDGEIARTQNDIREVRARAKALKGSMNSLDDSFYDVLDDGTPRANPADLKRMEQYTGWIRENYPQFEVEAGPRLMNLYSPNESLMRNLMLENDATGQFLFGWSPFTKMNNAIRSAVDSAIRPVRGRLESSDTHNRIYEVFLKHGAQKDEIKNFFDYVNDVLANERTFGFSHEQLPITRGVNAMGARQLTSQGMKAFSHNEKFIQSFANRYGGNGLERMYVPIAEAYNPVIRAIQRKIEQGGPVNRLQRLMESGYDAYHTAPGFNKLAVGTHALAKFIYPLVRFTLNPLYHVYNATESEIIGITQDGLRVRHGRTPKSAEVFNAVERGNFEANAGRVNQAKRMEAYGMDPALDAYSDELIRQATLDQTGVPFGYNTRRAAIMERQVDLRRPETIKDAIREFSATDPAMVAARKRYGGNVDDWIEGLTQDIYGIDAVGARKYIADLVKSEGWTKQELIDMAPLLDDVVNKMQGSFDDIYQLHVGNANRSRIERVLNSYWVFWPASYMLKANKWMFKVLTEGAFGAKTNLGGAWTLNQLAAEYHERYTRDASFRKIVDENDDLLFMLSSILPVAPWSDGVSMNRLTRYVGGNIGLWPQYSNFDPVDVTSWAGKMSEIGPLYSIPLAADVAKGAIKSLDFQGIDLGNPVQSAPAGGQSVPGF